LGAREGGKNALKKGQKVRIFLILNKESVNVFLHAFFKGFSKI